MSAWIAILTALFAWWFATGIILLVVRRADAGKAAAHGRNVFLSVPVLALGAAGFLFTARISAKLNLYFGVPRINTEFVPRPLEHVKSYFTKGPITAAFPIGVTFLSITAVCFAERLIGAQTAPFITGFALLTALAALAALEHWLMVVPLPDAKLWRWMLPDTPTSTKDKTHEF